MISSENVHCLNALGIVKKKQRDSIFILKNRTAEKPSNPLF